MVSSHGQQRQGGVWIFGRKYQLDFNKLPLKVDTLSKLIDFGTFANTCDSNGSLNFLVSRDTCYDRNLNPMPNGIIELGGINDSINNINSNYGSYFTIQKDTRIFIFHLANGVVPGVSGEFYPCFFTVDLSLNLGLGDLALTPRKYYFTPVRLEGLMTPMLHANGRDYWIVARKYRSDTLVSWLFQDQGWGQPVFSRINSKAHLLTPISFSGSMSLKSSPNSEFLYHPWLHRNYNRHELIRFDRNTGKATGTILLPDSFATNQIPTPYTNFMRDAAFSPDSRLLYLFTTHQQFTEKWPKFVHQYDLSVWDSVAINQSKIRVGVVNTQVVPLGGRLAGQLAIDGKIYVSNGDADTASSFNIIHCPNTRGLGCNFQVKGLRFPKVAFMTGPRRLPTLNQTLVRNAGILQLQANKRQICQSDTLELSGYGAGAERFQWSVSPAFPASVKLDTLTWQKIPTRQLSPGTYTFSCRAFSRCGDVFEKTIAVEVKPLPARPVVTTIQKTVPCKGDSVIVKVQNPVLGNQYFWSTGDTAAFTIVRQTGLYSLDSVSNAVGCGIKVGDTLAVSVKNVLVPVSPVLVSPQLVEVCTGEKAKLKVKSEADSGAIGAKLRVIWSNALEGDSVLVGSPGKYWAIHQTEEGCTSGASDTITVVIEPLPVVQLVASDNGHCLGNEETKEYKVLSQNVKVKTVEVEGGEVVEETDSTLTIHWFEGTQTQAPWEAFSLKIKSQNRLGCFGADVVFSPVPNPEACRELYPLFIPNLVTDNHDNHNDRWEMGNILYHQPVSVRIYNRWGQTVFETDSYQNNWPATSLSSGTYFYRVSSFGKEWKGWMEVK
jgi:gliding motility-associated-like protein